MQGERPLFLQLDHSKSLMATALVQILTANEWFYVSLIAEESYVNDGFVDAFLRLTGNTSLWQVEDRITVAHLSSQSAVDYQLLNLLENQSRVVVLHCSPRTAKVVFRVAESNDFVRGYAWFVTEDVVRTTRGGLEAFPVGLVAVRVGGGGGGGGGYPTPEVLIPKAVQLIAAGLERFHRERRRTRRPGSTVRSAPRHSVSTDRDCGSAASRAPNEAGEMLYKWVNSWPVGSRGVSRGFLSCVQGF